MERTLDVLCGVCGDTWALRQVRISGTNLWMPPSLERGPCPSCAEIQRAMAEAEQARLAAEEEARRTEKVREQRAAQILDLLEAAGVNTAEHGRATLDNFDARGCGPAPLERVRRLLAETRRATRHDSVRGLYLLGDTGAGKSHLAVAAVRELLLDPAVLPEGIVYDTSLELIGEIQDTYTTHASAKAVLARRKRARLWVLDDFGTENPSNDVVRRLTEIFTARAMRPTLVTSNVDPNDLTGKHAEFFRLFSRLGPAYFDVTRVQGRDRRMERAA